MINTEFHLSLCILYGFYKKEFKITTFLRIIWFNICTINILINQRGIN
jgi:hypothetical protein